MIEIFIQADVVSKKNIYSQTKTGRRFKPKSVVDTEQLAMMQIPDEYKGLNLKHPAVEFWATIPKKSWALDRDGVYTTILDYLVKCSVLSEDNIRNFNGIVIQHPVIDGPRKLFKIRLYEDGKIPTQN